MDITNSTNNTKPTRLKIFLRSILNSIILYYILFILIALYIFSSLSKRNYSLSFEEIVLSIFPLNPFSLMILVLLLIPIWITNSIYAKIHPEYFTLKNKKNFFTIFFVNFIISGLFVGIIILANGGKLFSH